MNSNDKLTAVDVCPENQYAITLSRKEVSANGKQKILPMGSIFKIESLNEYGYITFSVVMVHDKIVVPQDTIYNSPDITRIQLFSKDILRFIVPIKPAEDRVNFIKSTEKQSLVMNLKPEDPIKIPQTAFNNYERRFRRGIIKHFGCVIEMGPGYYFIVSLLGRDRRFVPTHLDEIIEKYIGKSDFSSVIVSAEFIYHYQTDVYPFDTKLFHAYDNPVGSTRMLRTRLVDRIDGVHPIVDLCSSNLCSSSQSQIKRKLPNNEISASGNLTSSRVSENQNRVLCPVCLESSVGRQPHVTNCGHIFCSSCIRESIRINKKCPTCQKMLSVEMIFPVYI